MRTIGIDLGGTKTLAVLVEDGVVVEKAKRPTPRVGSPDDVLTTMAKVAASVDPDATATAIGIGAPGPVVPGTGHSVASPSGRTYPPPSTRTAQDGRPRRDPPSPGRPAPDSRRAQHRMTAFILYLASLAGAVGLFLIMRPHRRSTRLVGTILGAGAVAFLMVQVLQSLADDATVPILEVVFGLGSIAGAVRMVTHPRPVFAAIWFVMVVVCSAGMFLLLDAEFMAFSLVIVYAGAILITYLFVLMLAQEATGSAGEALYDRLPREPIAALVVGFVLLASIGDALLVVDGGVAVDGPDRVAEATKTRWEILDGLPRQLERHRD